MGHALSENHGSLMIETSAKSGIGLERAIPLLLGFLQRTKEIKIEGPNRCCIIL